MSKLHGFLLPTALILALAPVARAGDDKATSDKKPGDQTIRGVVSEVTLFGETDVDYKTRKAVTAEATYLTIIGHPWNSEAARKEGVQASSDKDKDKDVKRTSGEASKPGDRPRHRMNVYVLAVSPKTKVCECKESGKEGSASAKEEACDLDKLEIGDRVEVCFEPKMMKGSEEKGNEANASQKHGRHRVFFGVAKDIKIQVETMEGKESAEPTKK